MASRLQDVIARGLAASRPAATTVAPGTLYYSTDSATTARSNGTIWETYTDAGGSGGAPAAHATTHQVAGSDIVDVKLLGGYPGGTTTFLRADATFAVPVGSTPPIRYSAIGMNIDGNSVVITTGVKGFLPIPFACTILEWTLLSTDASVLAGSIVIDIWKRNLSVSYPPTVLDTITAAAKPTLSADNKATSSTLTGWTTSIVAGDILGFNVNSVSSVTKITLVLKIQMV